MCPSSHAACKDAFLTLHESFTSDHHMRDLAYRANTDLVDPNNIVCMTYAPFS